MVTAIALDDDTERRPAVRALPPAQPKSDFYIIAPTCDEEGADETVHGLEDAPFEVFWVWLDGVVKAEKRQGLLLSTLIRGFDALQSVRFIDEHGIDMSKYLFTRHEAAVIALEAMKAARESAGGEGGNGKS